jgi:glutamyl-tRNA reductase
MQLFFKLTGCVWMMFWGLVLLHIQIFFCRAFVSASSTKPSTPSVKMCPFKAAKKFLEQPTAFLVNSLFTVANIRHRSAAAGLGTLPKASEIIMTMDSEAWKRFHHLHHQHSLVSNPSVLDGSLSSSSSSSSYHYKHASHFTSPFSSSELEDERKGIGRKTTCYSCSYYNNPAVGIGIGSGTAGMTSTSLQATNDPNALAAASSFLSFASSSSSDEERAKEREREREEKEEGKGKNGNGNGGDHSLDVVVIGLSHHNAKVEIREKLAIPEDRWNEVSRKLVSSFDSIAEASILSTCNRFEIYLTGSNSYEMIKDAMSFLTEYSQDSLDPVTLRSNLFMLSGEDAIWHLLRVAGGLDSLMIGEGQILAQVKKCYEHGIEGGSSSPAGKVLSRLLNNAVAAGKRVRSETGISKGAVSISSAAAEFTSMKLKEDCDIDEISDANIVIIGAGKMTRLLLAHLESQGIKKITIVNRSMDRMVELQNEFPSLSIEMKGMEDLWNVLQEADVCYPSTSSPFTIINPEPLSTMLSQRKKATNLQFVDISVPRNIHPDCSSLPRISNYNVDDLKAVVERNTAKRRREMIEAENILKDELGKFRVWQQSLGAIPTIAKLQEKAENMRKEEMMKAAKKLSTLSTKDLEIVERVTKGIVAKLLHGPMSHLRQQSEGIDGTRTAIEQLHRAFQLGN